MEVLRVAQTCYPDVAGGGAYHVHAMSRDQAALGHDVTVLTVRHDPERPHVEEREGYTVVRYDPTASPLGNELSAGLARHLHRATDDVDVVHAHSHLYASTNLAALERWLGGTPLAITNHGLYSQTVPARAFAWYLRTLGRWTFERADLVFCYTDADERRLRDLGVTTDVAVIPNGVDTDRFAPEGPGSDCVGDGPAVAFVGRLVEGKRPGDAIEAFERVRSRVPGARLYLCGDGPLRADLEARVERSQDGLADAISFLGHVPYEEMPGIFRSADVLVLPSRAEGVPRTVLEARASGTPVVASDLDTVAALDDDGVRTVPVGDVDGLAAATASVLDGSAADEGSIRSADGESTRFAGGEPTRSVDGESIRSVDGNSASIADGGHDGDGGDGGDDRTAYDWRETVHRTTAALETLHEAHA